LPDDRTRRQWLKDVGTIDAGSLFAAVAPVQQPAAASPNGTLLPLTSSSDVYIPRGRAFQKFSFDFPEPAVAFEGLLFSFWIFTGENTYTLDGSAVAIKASERGFDLSCDRFVFAGGKSGRRHDSPPATRPVARPTSLLHQNGLATDDLAQPS
jgi:hypothetical protein